MPQQRLSDGLQCSGKVQTWFDDWDMRGEVTSAMCNGIDGADAVLVRAEGEEGRAAVGDDRVLVPEEWGVFYHGRIATDFARSWTRRILSASARRSSRNRCHRTSP